MNAEMPPPKHDPQPFLNTTLSPSRQSDLRKTSVKHFLDHLGNNLADNDNWVQAPNVEFYPVAKKWKPSRSTAFGFVLRRILAHINNVPFNPAHPEHLGPMTDMEKRAIIKTIEEAGLGVLSLNRVDSGLAVNACGQLIEVVCIGWQRLKNVYNPTQIAKIIHHFRTADFEEASGALKSLIDGTNYAPKNYVSQATKNAILKKAAEKWKSQEFSVRKAYILNYNPAAKSIKDIRKWLEHEPELLLERLGYINPVTGHIIDPDDFCFDR
ncbi:hypothetical protein HK100_006179 [Physocladia obscura]|uniref:Uncharacterized protein n=1 Tax=Physocladia obscura TaxID=109957 RepID=A0AAD5SQR8_9FUNG|nr:hypothetical protein HK100_006179 [Physocladia obscura]